MPCFLHAAAALLALTGLTVGLRAQPPIPPPAAPAPAAPAKTVRDVREVPFTLVNGKIYIDTLVNGQGPYPFVLDTGSPPTIIDTDLAKMLELTVQSMGSVGGAGEGSTPSAAVNDVTLTFGDVTIDRRRGMMGVAINRRLRGFGGHEVMGLIGNDWVSQHVVEIDYAHQKLRIYDSEGWEYQGEGVIVPTRTRSYTLVKGTVTPPAGSVPDGKADDDGGEGAKPKTPGAIPLNFAIDTGAGLSVSISTGPVNTHHLLDLKTPMVETIVGYGLGGEVLHHVARMDSLTLGDAIVARPTVTLSQDKAGALSGANFNGIIGYEVLSKFTVIFDAARTRMILEKNDSYAEPMEWDMSGIVFAGDGEGGRLRVYRIAEGSPAASADIKVGDLLLTLDGEKVSKDDRDRVRMQMRKDGAQRTLELKRGDETIKVTITLKRMI